MSCKRVRATLDEQDVTIAETQVEKKATRLGPEDGLRLARESSHVYVAKGKKVVHFVMADGPADEDLLKHLIGRSGFLRAPAVRTGDRFIVGYNAQMYEDLLA